MTEVTSAGAKNDDIGPHVPVFAVFSDLSKQSFVIHVKGMLSRIPFRVLSLKNMIEDNYCFIPS